MSIVAFLDQSSVRFPERTAFVHNERSSSYREFSALSCRIAGALTRDGTATGAKIAIYAPNDLVGFCCTFGALRMGGVWVPVNARGSLADNIALLQDSDCEVLFYHSTFEQHVDRIRTEVGSLRQFICIDRPGATAPALADWLAEIPATITLVELPAEAPCLMVGTGGTTGRPKIVELSRRNLDMLFASYYLLLPSSEPQVFLAATPLTHAAGVQCMPALGQGGKVIILDSFEPVAVMRAIELHRVTTLFLPPTAIYALLAHPDVRYHDYRSLRYFLYGASPMSVDKLKEAVAVFGPVMTQLYGQTEAPVFCSVLHPLDHAQDGDGDWERRLASAGRVSPFMQVEIMDDDGRLLALGEPGEIVVRGDLVMTGYYRNPEATAAASTFGWHHTGDIGIKSEDGLIHIVDRKKDMIITGGFNVYPSEVEQTIWSHPAVQDCAVIGVPDDKWGEAVKAVVELKPGASVEPGDLIALCKDRLGSVKAPKSIEIWDSLPRSPVGKVLKRDVRERFWQGVKRRI
ncbi:MAG: AMP-binding protein [Betaproteobacteria bacterium]|nr:AMP-binding protein [Betaproteobacteria bacterium]